MKKPTSKKLTFKTFDDDLWFEHHEKPPGKSIQFRIKGETAYKVNPQALQLYFLYRKTVQNSYSEKGKNLAHDIQHWNKAYDGHNKFEGNNLHHYAVDACIDSVQEWLKQEKPVQCYMAYQQSKWGPKIAGFVHFYKTTVKEKDVVYISQAGVAERNSKIGTRLMKLVMAHFEPKTEFYILTRKFNTEATHLYANKFHYTSIEQNEINKLGYDKRYIGFKHTTKTEEIDGFQKEISRLITQDTIEDKYDSNIGQHTV